MCSYVQQIIPGSYVVPHCGHSLRSTYFYSTTINLIKHFKENPRAATLAENQNQSQDLIQIIFIHLLRSILNQSLWNAGLGMKVLVKQRHLN